MNNLLKFIVSFIALSVSSYNWMYLNYNGNKIVSSIILIITFSSIYVLPSIKAKKH